MLWIFAEWFWFNITGQRTKQFQIRLSTQIRWTHSIVTIGTYTISEPIAGFAYSFTIAIGIPGDRASTRRFEYHTIV